MTKVNLNCRFCGKKIVYDTSEKMFTCTHCGQSFLISEFLSESELANIDNMQPNEIERRITVSNLIIDGEQCLYKADYAAAEKNFKKAIELDNRDSRAFYGVVKAMTQNFNVLPQGEEYKLFIKRALELADGEQKKQISIQLEKLEVLKKEAQAKAAKLQNPGKLKTFKAALVSKLPYLIVFALTAFLLVAIVLSMLPKPDTTQGGDSTIEIYSASDLKKLQNNSSALSATIVLMNDIDYANGNWIPVGTASSPFTGKFCGNNHKISNLTIAAGEGSGFFGYCNNAEILSLKLDGVKISGTSDLSKISAGIVAGYAKNTTIKLVEALPKCSISLSCSLAESLTVGGLVGYLEGGSIANSCSYTLIDYSSTAPTLDIKIYIGGLLGILNNSQMSHCLTSSAINVSVGETASAKLYVSGIAGASQESGGKNYIINYSCFMGLVSVSCDETKLFLSGVSFMDETSNVKNNLIFKGSDTFKVNDRDIENSALCDSDFDESRIQVFSDQSKLMAELHMILDAEFWTDSATSEPHLK